MAATKLWTLEDLHALPDDSIKYELVHGELLVTPAPTTNHETIAARIARALEPYVVAHDLGYVYRPRAVIQHDGSQVEPDLMVRTPGDANISWAAMSIPILVVEILSPSTSRHDREAKRRFYFEIGVADYWIVDPATRAVTPVQRGQADVVTGAQLTWQPAGATAPFVVQVSAIFG
jgi:Uma2 family endonuclease